MFGMPVRVDTTRYHAAHAAKENAHLAVGVHDRYYRERGVRRSQFLGVLGEVFRDALGGCLHGILAFLPAGRADFAVFLEKLQRIDHAQHFVDFAAERQIVNHLVLDDALTVDQERAAQRDAVRMLDAVGASDLMLDVGDDGKADRADAALFHRRVAPGGVGELRIDRHADQLSTALAELGRAVVVGDDLGRTHEGEIQRPEEQHDIFAAQTRQTEIVFDAAVRQYSGRYEIRRRLGH